MTAGSHNFSCTRGQSFSAAITVKQPNADLADLNAWSSRMHVRKTVGASTTVVELTTANSRITHDLVNSKISLSLSASETAALDAGDHVYDLELFTVGGAVLRLIKGNFSVG